MIWVEGVVMQGKNVFTYKHADRQTDSQRDRQSDTFISRGDPFSKHTGEMTGNSETENDQWK